MPDIRDIANQMRGLDIEQSLFVTYRNYEERGKILATPQHVRASAGHEHKDFRIAPMDGGLRIWRVADLSVPEDLTARLYALEVNDFLNLDARKWGNPEVVRLAITQTTRKGVGSRTGAFRGRRYSVLRGMGGEPVICRTK